MTSQHGQHVNLLLRYCTAQVSFVGFNLSWILGARGLGVVDMYFSAGGKCVRGGGGGGVRYKKKT